MNDIVLKEKQLPDNIPDLAKFALVGREKLAAVRAEINAIQKLGLANDVLEQKRTEAQEIAELVTLSEVRVGEMLREIPKTSGGDRKSEDFKKRTSAHFENIDKTEHETINNEPTTQTKTEIIRSAGIAPDTAKRFQKMAEHKELVVKAIEEAREKNDIISRATVLNKIKQEERKELIQKQVEEIEKGNIEKPTGLFDVIAIDPPWNYGTQYSSEGRRVANPYPEMTQEQLKALEIPAKENCVMFLWTTHKFIWDAKELLDKWGFTYRAMLVWDKEKIGMGDLVRMQCEFCLIGIKGKPVFKDEHGIRDIIREPRREHSRKPDAFYELVNSLCVGDKLDYFSREHREGWCSYGNDTEKF